MVLNQAENVVLRMPDMTVKYEEKSWQKSHIIYKESDTALN